MNVRQLISNALALLLLLGGAGLVLFWLAGLFAPEAEPPGGGGRMGAATMATQAVAGPILGTPTASSVTSTAAGATPTAAFPRFTPTPWSLNGQFLAVEPAYPAPDEPLHVAILGRGPADCRPEVMGFQVQETGFVPIDLSVPSARARCHQPVTPFTDTLTLDPLPPGHWVVEVYRNQAGVRTRYAAQTVYVAPPGPTPVVTPTQPGDFPTRTPPPPSP